jgi:Uma2 family endonuclease
MEFVPTDLLDDDRYFKFCHQNPKLRIERTKDGTIVIAPPAGLESSDHEIEVGAQLRMWAKRDRRGRCFGASAGYILPSRAVFASDASWVSNAQLSKLDEDEKSRFPT